MKMDKYYRKHENIVDNEYYKLKERKYQWDLIGRHVNYGVTYNKTIDEVDLIQFKHIKKINKYYFILHEVKGNPRLNHKAARQLKRAYDYIMKVHKNKNVRVFTFRHTGRKGDLEGKIYDTKWLIQKQ